MESVRGKIKNKTAGEELVFSINPVEWTLSQSYAFSTEPCLGAPSPIIAFKTSEPACISMSLVFDKDADKDCDLQKLATFIKGFNKIDEKTLLPPTCVFVHGQTNFEGYIHRYVYKHCRFDPKGNPTRATLDLTLISNGTYEKSSTS